MIVIGGGGHGPWQRPITSSREHGITNVAVLEKGWIGLRQCPGRNTTIVRLQLILLRGKTSASTNTRMKLWEGLFPRAQLQRHVLAARRAQPRPPRRPSSTSMRGAATPMRHEGGDAVLLGREEVARMVPGLDVSGSAPLSRCRGPFASRAPAPPATTPSPGDMPARPTGSRRHPGKTARSPASCAKGEKVVGVTSTRGDIRAAKGRGRRCRLDQPRHAACRHSTTPAHREPMCCRPSCRNR